MNMLVLFWIVLADVQSFQRASIKKKKTFFCVQSVRKLIT